MNRIAPGFKLSKAVLGFQQHKEAEALSPRTLVSYEQHLRLWLEHIGDQEVGQITTQDLRASRSVAWARSDSRAAITRSHPKQFATSG